MTARRTRVLVIDNYDSFTYNLVQILGAEGAAVDVVRNDEVHPRQVVSAGFERIVISPGPCTPAEAGISVDVARELPAHGVSVLGVCLGHQAIVHAFGGTVARTEPVHGKAGLVAHDGAGLLRGLPSPFPAGRYHSLVAYAPLPDVLAATAWTQGLIMGVRHRDLPVEGVQFHPESVLTPDGVTLLRTFLRDGCGAARAVPGHDGAAVAA